MNTERIQCNAGEFTLLPDQSDPAKNSSTLSFI